MIMAIMFELTAVICLGLFSSLISVKVVALKFVVNADDKKLLKQNLSSIRISLLQKPQLNFPTRHPLFLYNETPLFFAARYGKFTLKTGKTSKNWRFLLAL